MTAVMIMAGGTGGHVFPALAVAEVLRQRGSDIAWIGTERGIESRLVPEAGYPLHFISVAGLRGNGLAGWLMAPFRLVKAVAEAITVLRQFKPDVVMGLGGFASGPGGVAAWLLRKPVVIHEQNAIPGLTNTLLAKLAKHVLQGFPNSFDSNKAQWVGNPVRASIAALAEPTPNISSNINILVLGGSLGAKALNAVLPEALSQLEIDKTIQVRHQCGQKHIIQCQQAYQQHNVTAEISAFIDDMAAAYEWADIVVCRAGALTVAEVASAGVAAIFIPFPYAVDDHQTHNAMSLVNIGGGQLIQEADLTASGLQSSLQMLIKDPDRRLQMALAAKTQAKPEAANDIADICQAVANG